MNKKKKITIVIILSSILVLILAIFMISNSNYDKKIERYITKVGFENNSNTYLYSKRTSMTNYEKYQKDIEEGKDTEYEVMYFNTSTYQLIEDKTTYSNNITKNLTSTYDYTNDDLSYIYRINLSNTNIIIEGTYKNDNFTCEPTFFYQVDIENSLKTICKKVEFEIKSFDDKATTLFDNSKLVEYMKKTNN